MSGDNPLLPLGLLLRPVGHLEQAFSKHFGYVEDTFACPEMFA